MVKKQAKIFDVIDGAAATSDIEGFIGYNLKRAYMVMQADFRASLGRDGLAPRVFTALSLAIENPDVTQSELARLLGIERSGLVAIVDDLEARGYLERTAVPGDRRVHALVPTQAGRDAYKQAVEIIRAHENSLLEHFSQDERQTLIALLQKIRKQEKTL